jgi:hypothetical protein
VFFNPQDPDGTWTLDLAEMEEHQVCEMCIALALNEPGENWAHETFNGTSAGLRHRVSAPPRVVKAC